MRKKDKERENACLSFRSWRGKGLLLLSAEDPLSFIKSGGSGGERKDARKWFFLLYQGWPIAKKIAGQKRG